MTSTNFTFPYYVVPALGKVNINTEAGAAVEVFPATAINDVLYYYKETRVYGLANGDTALTSPTMTQDNYASSNSQISATPFRQWVVRIRLDDDKFFDVPMGKVGNQVTWVNTEAGAQIAVGAIRSTVWA